MKQNFAKNMIVRSLVVTAVLSTSILSGVAVSEAADSTVHINKDRLKTACKSAGGRFFSSGKNKRYGCVTDNISVSCNKKRNCVAIKLS